LLTVFHGAGKITLLNAVITWSEHVYCIDMLRAHQISQTEANATEG